MGHISYHYLGIHVADGSVRYAYSVLDTENRLFQGFDNSPDIRASKQRYGPDYKQHLHERIPHQHSSEDTLTLTESMNFDAFMAWLTNHLPRESGPCASLEAVAPIHMTVGHATVERLPVAISELFPPPSTVDGLLGMDFLGQFIVTLDHAAQQMWLAARQPVKP